MELNDILIATAVYAICTVAFFPGLLLTLAYGAIYGTFVGGCISLFGATIGASLATLIARRYLRTSLLARLLSDIDPSVPAESDDGSKRPALWQKLRTMVRDLYELVERYSERTVIITRLTPVVPFNLLNYLLGLTTLPVWKISLLSFVCMAPACFVYAWIASSGASAVRESDPRYLLHLLAGVALLFLLKPVATRIIDHIKNRAGYS